MLGPLQARKFGMLEELRRQVRLPSLSPHSTADKECHNHPGEICSHGITPQAQHLPLTQTDVGQKPAPLEELRLALMTSAATVLLTLHFVAKCLAASQLGMQELTLPRPLQQTVAQRSQTAFVGLTRCLSLQPIWQTQPLALRLEQVVPVRMTSLTVMPRCAAKMRARRQAVPV